MKQLILWYLCRRWLVKKVASQLSNEQRQKLLATLTANGMIPATGIIQSDAAFICLFHEPKFDRKKFMQGWRLGKRCVTDMLHIGALIVLDGTERSKKCRDYDSFDQGAELAVEQFHNMMASRRH